MGKRKYTTQGNTENGQKSSGSPPNKKQMSRKIAQRQKKDKQRDKSNGLNLMTAYITKEQHAEQEPCVVSNIPTSNSYDALSDLTQIPDIDVTNTDELTSTDAAPDIAVNTTAVKHDIKRIETLLMTCQHENSSHHDAISFILKNIDTHIISIEHQVKQLDRTVAHLQQQNADQDVKISQSQKDIINLFQMVQEIQTARPPVVPPVVSVAADPIKQQNTHMDIEHKTTMIEERCVIIKNLPPRTRKSGDTVQNCDEEDLHALLYLGLGLNMSEPQITSFKRIDDNNIKVEMCSKHTKIKMLRKKRRTRRTEEYKHVFINNIKCTKYPDIDEPTSLDGTLSTTL